MTSKAQSPLLLAIIFAMFQSLSGCAGDDGTSVDTSNIDALQAQIDALTAEAALGAANDVVGEQCSLCHTGDTPVAYTGADHQAYYDQFYQDQGIIVENIAYAFSLGPPGIDIVTFEMSKKDENGVYQDFDCRDATTNPEPDQSDALSIYFVQYDETNRTFFNPSDGGSSTDFDDDRLSIRGQTDPTKQTATDTLEYDVGTNICTSTKEQNANLEDNTGTPIGALGDLNLKQGYISVYGRDETLDSNSAKRISNPKFPFAAILKTGTGTVDYVSNAKSEGCENCHTKPFLKHAYIYGEVNAGDVGGATTGNDTNDFYVCKNCHLDNGSGGHQDWQLLADDPARHAALAELAEAAAAIGDKSKDSVRENMSPDELTKYAYTTRLMNDVHMAHSMEFGFPQSMKTCATCHSGAGQVAAVLADENFTGETCKSCHSVDGLVGNDTIDPPVIGKMTATTALAAIHSLAVDNLDDDAFCIQCHSPAATALQGPLFSELHTGYDKEIYADAAGLKYSDAFSVSVDSASFDAATNILTIGFSADENTPVTGLSVAEMVPTVMIGPYGKNSKQYIVNPHGRDADRNRLLEYNPGTVHPRFTTVTADTTATTADWVVTADLSTWADMIADGTITRLEIGFMPELYLADNGVDDRTLAVNQDSDRTNNFQDDTGIVAMDAPSRTFDITVGANGDFVVVDGFEVVDVQGGCNSCHDALATTFHSAKRGGNIKICKMCHEPSSAGSHLEMQSRAIDSYVHAMHSFQVFDIGDIDETDPVEAAEHAHHIKSDFPNFGIENCEACHNPGTYDVPDQGKSLPSLHAGSDDVDDRNIGTVPKYVMGPASRACGACHRAQMTKDDDANRLSAFNAHVAAQGYLVEDGDGVWDAVVKKIMSMF